MAEIFKEYLVKQKKSSKDTVAQIGIGLGVAVLVYLALAFGGGLIGPVIVLVVLFGGMTFFNQFNKEYEYILTNNDLDIDVIFNRSKRKRVITCDMKKIEVMASIQDAKYKHELEKADKIINASDGNNDANTYALMIRQNSHFYKILLTPNEAFLNELYRQAPHKVFKYNA